ncbi:S9 family peptidase [bacterium]|nr:S9 family peptidase [bacterium]
MKQHTTEIINMRKYAPLIALVLLIAILGCTRPLDNVILRGERKIEGYKEPPPEISQLINSVKSPYLIFDKKGEKILLIDRPEYPTIRSLDVEELGLAGIRLDPDNYGPSKPWTFDGLRLMDVVSGNTIPISGLAENARCRTFKWSPDSKWIAFLVYEEKEIQLWVADSKTGAARFVGNNVNAVYWGDSFGWSSDSLSIFYKQSIPELLKGVCEPISPMVKESTGEGAAQITYKDLLKNETDVKLFKAYATVQLVKADLGGKNVKIGDPRMIIYLDISPDGKYLLIESTHEPFSYTVPAYRFPRRVEVWAINGEELVELADLPLMENIPTMWETAEPGMRKLHWRSDVPSTLFYAVAQDEGDPRKDVPFRDKGYLLSAPFTGEGKEIFTTEYRFKSIEWGRDDLAVVHERWHPKRIKRIFFIDPSSPGKMKEVFSLNSEDVYKDPGAFLTTETDSGHFVLRFSPEGDGLYLKGKGASPDGAHPFLDKLNISSLETERLFESGADVYEYVVKMNYPSAGQIVTRRESGEQFPNYLIKELGGDKESKITDFPHPYPHMKDLKGKFVAYKRKDGVQLSAKLFLPPDYKKEDGPLPVIMWVYPKEFKSARTASQRKGSSHRFTNLEWWSQAIWVTRGYAVFDGPTMPIIGEGDNEPNDTYLEQLIMSAEAAIDKLKQLGITDGKRIAIGGHSYGAFTAANLVAHTDLFSTAVCRTGAYNRTLTPYGFQSERRTFWEAQETYIEMSPFMNTDKIKEPVLLIHGANDSNPGTYPIQSERFYDALKAHGVTVKLVMLPFEDHSYKAKESVMHVLWETDQWFEKYVKNAGE